MLLEETEHLTLYFACLLCEAILKAVFLGSVTSGFVLLHSCSIILNLSCGGILVYFNFIGFLKHQ